MKAKQENGISKLESSFGTPKTANLATLSTFLTKLLPNVKKLIPFYGNEHAGLRCLNYRGRQKADEYLASILIDGGYKYATENNGTKMTKRMKKKKKKKVEKATRERAEV